MAEADNFLIGCDERLTAGWGLCTVDGEDIAIWLEDGRDLIRDCVSISDDGVLYVSEEYYLLLRAMKRNYDG